MPHLDLTLGAQPVLLVTPPYWSVAIAIETDAAPDDVLGLYREPFSNASNSWDWERSLYGDAFERLFSGESSGLRFLSSTRYEKIGRNRGVITIDFDGGVVAGISEDIHDDLDDFQREMLGSTWVFDLTFTSDGAARFALTITKEGFLRVVIEGFVDFSGDGINFDEFPDELLLPDEPPQASGEDRSGVEVAAAATVRDIAADDIQTFLVNNPGLQPAAYNPGDWLEPKDGGNQRMMIVGPAGTAAAASFARNAIASAPAFGQGIRAGGAAAQRNEVGAHNGELISLSVVCMQIKGDIPTRGARFFSLPKSPAGTVQACQRDCVLAGGGNIQRCVWQCEQSNAASLSPIGEMHKGQPANASILGALGEIATGH